VPKTESHTHTNQEQTAVLKPTFRAVIWINSVECGVQCAMCAECETSFGERHPTTCSLQHSANMWWLQYHNQTRW
jgi:hypothetical protein